VVVDRDSCVVLISGCVVMERGPCVVLEMWLCGCGSGSLRGSRLVAVW
jgi:hypothetical protein